MSQLPYQPLPSPRSIRLLRFLPGDEPICRMITVEVEKAPPYVALSYTWGQKELNRGIVIDGQTVPTMRNLFDAIHAIHRFAAGKRLAFWADFICINQVNLDERGLQVRLMNTIYRSAEIVGIWLGPSADDSDLAFDVIEKEWKPKFDKLLKLHNGSRGRAAASIVANDDSLTGPVGSPQYKAIQAFYQLLHRQRWTRAWVVQEGTVAHPSRAVLFCGDRKFDWTVLRTALRIAPRIAASSEPQMRSTFYFGQAIYLDHFRNLREIRRFQCEDPRDKVYAALGMAMDINENDIVPNYTKPYAEVYTDVARYFISNGHWKVNTAGTPLRKELDLDGFDDHRKVYSASAGIPGNPHMRGLKLHLQGSFLDSINNASTKFPHGLPEAHEIKRLTNPTSLYFNGQAILEAFNHTMVADVGTSDLINTHLLTRGFSADWTLINTATAQLNAEQRLRQSWMEKNTYHATYGRRFFRTSRGYMGLAPAAARLGDKVCVFFGGQVLYMIRGRGDGCFKFVGECYVHGMMDGQACAVPWFEPREFILV